MDYDACSVVARVFLWTEMFSVFTMVLLWTVIYSVWLLGCYYATNVQCGC